MRKCTSFSPSHFVWESDSDEEDDDNGLLDLDEGSDADTAETIASAEPTPPCAQGRGGSGRERAAKVSPVPVGSADLCGDIDDGADLRGDTDDEAAESAAPVKSSPGPPGNWGPRAPPYAHAAAVGREARASPDEAELEAFRPRDTTPQFQAGAKGRAMPSIGSAGHDDAQCRPCAFFNQGVCGAGASCGFCHMKHKRNYHAQSKKKRERYRRLIAFKQAVQTVATVGTTVDDPGTFHRYQW